MSTKIYDGKRIPLEKLEDFKSFVEDYQFNLIIEHIKTVLFGFVDEEMVKKEYQERYGGSSGRDWEEVKTHYTLDHIIDKARESSKTLKKDPLFCLDAGWSFFVKDEWIYLRPWGNSNFRREIDDNFPEWVEDFSYWNNTGKPDNVSREEWKHREETWDEFDLSFDIDPMKIEIVNFGNSDDWVFEHKIKQKIIDSYG